jgi:hypothetical protein
MNETPTTPPESSKPTADQTSAPQAGAAAKGTGAARIRLQDLPWGRQYGPQTYPRALLPGISLREDKDATESRERLLEWQRQATKLEEERRQAQALPPVYIVHTIHGTFAKKAKWITDNGPFCQTLNRTLGWRTKIEPFRWSGKNSVFARRDAAIDFKNHLKQKIDFWGDAKHIIVAHSHGGNIAFMALSSSDLASKVLGVATLATPFLSAGVRESVGDELIDQMTGIFASLFVGLATLFAGYWSGVGWSRWPWALGVCFGTMGVLALGAFASRHMGEYAQRISKAVPHSALSPDRVVIIRVDGDEALAAITGARLAGTLAELLWAYAGVPCRNVIDEMIEWMDYLGMRSLRETARRLSAKQRSYLETLGEGKPGPYALRHEPEIPSIGWSGELRNSMNLLVPLLPTVIFAENENTVTRIIAMILVCLYAMPAALAVALAAIRVPFGVLSAISLTPCGLTLPLAGSRLRMTAEATPSGTWSVTRFDSAMGTGLQHSKAYDGRSAEFIASWVRRRAAHEDGLSSYE